MGAVCLQRVRHLRLVEDVEQHLERQLRASGLQPAGLADSRLTNWARLLATLGLALAVAGCAWFGDQDLPAPSVLTQLGVPEPGSLPPIQAAALADGAVTREEYAQAFQAFARCAEDRGDPLDVMGTDVSTGLVRYGTSEVLGIPGEAAATPQGRCYEETFSWVELVFQLTDPTLLEQGKAEQDALYAAEGAACLVKNGLDAPAEVDTRTPEGLEWFDRYTDLAADQKC